MSIYYFIIKNLANLFVESRAINLFMAFIYSLWTDDVTMASLWTDDVTMTYLWPRGHHDVFLTYKQVTTLPFDR